MPAKPAPKKVAIVCDWITERGGAEKMIHGLHRAFPNAPIYTSTYVPGASTMFKDATVRTSWLQKLPSPLRNYKLLTLFRQRHFSRLTLTDYDVVISIGSAESKAVNVAQGTHINICYTPTLYYWVKPDNYLQKGTGGVNPIWRIGLKLLLPRARRWDKRAAQNPDKMYGISSAVNQRIERYYDRTADGVVFPPVDTGRFTGASNAKHSGFITFGRQVKHKRFDLAVQACTIARAPLTVVGDGPEHENLRKLAGDTVSFKTNVDDSDLEDLLQVHEAFIFPNEEDFGIVGPEAQAAGLPVIAYRAGGALDTVAEGVTGEFFDEQTPESLARTIRSFSADNYSSADLLAQAKKFDTKEFIRTIQEIVNKEANN